MTENPRFVILDDRGLLAVTGPDRVSFLQGLVSNDMEKAGPGRAVYAALLSPQGKYLYDFFVVELDGALLLDCERAGLEGLAKRLSLYKLRADVTIEDRSDEFCVAALFGDGALAALALAHEPGAALAFGGGMAFTDPRLTAVGGRSVLPRPEAEAALIATGCDPAEASDYDSLRLHLGLPDASRDLIAEKSILLEGGFDELNGVDWDKGCYMGQELTARTKYRGLIKKRLMPVTFDGPPPEPGTPVMAGEKEAGEVRSSLQTAGGGIGLALMRLAPMAEAAETGADLLAEGIKVTPTRPDWMKLPD
jgi:folate-binding protein YgfZ